jgi:hypothetical protein
MEELPGIEAASFFKIRSRRLRIALGSEDYFEAPAIQRLYGEDFKKDRADSP